MSGNFEILFNELTSKNSLHNNYIKSYSLKLSSKELKKECRRVLDKIAITVIENDFEDERLIQAVLSLARIERIIIVLNIIFQINLTEIAFLLGSDYKSLKVQKCTALKKLRNSIK